MAIFLHKLPYRKNAIHFLTMAIFPCGNFPIQRLKNIKIIIISNDDHQNQKCIDNRFQKKDMLCMVNLFCIVRNEY